jgi:hypothetical protein
MWMVTNGCSFTLAHNVLVSLLSPNPPKPYYHDKLESLRNKMYSDYVGVLLVESPMEDWTRMPKFM